VAKKKRPSLKLYRADTVQVYRVQSVVDITARSSDEARKKLLRGEGAVRKITRTNEPLEIAVPPVQLEEVHPLFPGKKTK